MRTNNGLRIIGWVVAGIVSTVLIITTLVTIGNIAGEHGRDHSISLWGDPIQGSVAGVDDQVHSSYYGPYQKVAVSYVGRLSTKPQALTVNMLIKDIPSGERPVVTVWEQASTGRTAVANASNYGVGFQETPFYDGGTVRRGTAMLATVLVVLVWVGIAAQIVHAANRNR